MRYTPLPAQVNLGRSPPHPIAVQIPNSAVEPCRIIQDLLRAARSRASRTHSDVDLLLVLAAASISAASEAVSRQYNRASRDEPFGSGGLPSLGFLLIQFYVRTETACLRRAPTLMYARKVAKIL